MNHVPKASALKEIDGASLWLADYNYLVGRNHNTVIHALRKWQVKHAENDLKQRKIPHDIREVYEDIWAIHVKKSELNPRQPLKKELVPPHLQITPQHFKNKCLTKNILKNYRQLKKDIDLLSDCPAYDPDTDRILTQKLEELTAINKKIDALENLKEREIIRMRFCEGLTVKKIATLIHYSEKQVKNLYQQGVQKLTS